MSRLTSRQMRIARNVGGVVDELSLRNAAAGRAIDAVREQRSRLKNEIARIDRRVRNEQLEADALRDAASKVTLLALRQEQATLLEQVADCERQIEETTAKRHKLTQVLASWSATLDAVLAFVRASRASLGIPFGSDLPRSYQSDVELSERPS